jgi:AraC-like DNA-binding protein
MMKNILLLKESCPIKAQNAGLFISRGLAMHPTRVIDSHELIFVKQGELDMWEEDQVFHLEAGQTLHLFPGRQHGSTKLMPLGLKFYWIHFEVEHENSRNTRYRGDESGLPLKIPQLAHLSKHERLESLYRIFLEDQETGSLSASAANLLTMLMLIEVAKADEEEPENTADQNVVASWAHTFIRINYDRPITTTSVAEALGYNGDYLGRIYRKAYGCTLIEAIHRRRVDVACNYLLDSKLTISQIAEKCGFNDPDYFRRIFRRCKNVSPGEYRKEFTRLHVNTH